MVDVLQLTARLERMNRYVGTPEEELQGDAAAKSVMDALRRVPVPPQPQLPSSAADAVQPHSDGGTGTAGPSSSTRDAPAAGSVSSPECRQPAAAHSEPSPSVGGSPSGQPGSRARQTPRRPSVDAATTHTSPAGRDCSAGAAAARARHVPLSARASSPVHAPAVAPAVPSSSTRFQGFDA
jgi:hypothetical protein